MSYIHKHFMDIGIESFIYFKGKKLIYKGIGLLAQAYILCYSNPLYQH